MIDEQPNSLDLTFRTARAARVGGFFQWLTLALLGWAAKSRWNGDVRVAAARVYQSRCCHPERSEWVPD
jgi:hypothetical protein